MIHDIPQPRISPDFTIEDIHKIREWNYERLKDATIKERLADCEAGAKPVLEQLDAMRREFSGAGAGN